VHFVELHDDELELQAFVVFDHDLFPMAAGGTRMLPDVARPEVARLARAMTWKLAACHVPCAGAKAGIRFAGGDRAAVLAAYKRALEPYRDTFLTGPDMGTFPADFLEGDEDPVPLWGQSYEGLDMDDLAAGHGVKASAAAALSHLRRALEGATVAIEGFGKVGAGTARACARAGARIIGVSTIDGLLADPDGLELDELFTLRERYGDRFVEHGSRRVRPREQLFELHCDVLVPGARPDVITPDVAGRVRAAAVAPAANIPYGAGAVDVLHRRGILALPDFVSNSGGVHLYASVSPDDDPKAALARIEAVVHEAVLRVLATAEERRVTPLAAALQDARDYLARETGASRDVLDGLFPDASRPTPRTGTATL
jgi:glutamate dehydrogenase (NAD(P)+)